MTPTPKTSATTEHALGVARCPFCGTLTTADLSADTLACSGCGKPILTDRPMPVTGEDFGHIISQSKLPVLVDFYADWCAPCRMMAPVLDELARTRKGRLQILKLDTDRYPEIAGGLGIRGIPTLILFKDGDEANRQVGMAPRQMLEEMIDNI